MPLSEAAMTFVMSTSSLNIAMVWGLLVRFELPQLNACFIKAYAVETTVAFLGDA
jgi:hypothetical protein